MGNRGQQRLPFEMANGVWTSALFQVAEVFHPLISVAELCETGNFVIFGVSGGGHPQSQVRARGAVREPRWHLRL